MKAVSATTVSSSIGSMAKRIITQLVDDLDGTLLGSGSGGSIDFSIDGKRYQIDLTDAHMAELRAALAPYMEAARLVSASPVAPRPKEGTRSPKELGQIRGWANAHGYAVSSRGRIPANIIEAYDVAR